MCAKHLAQCLACMWGSVQQQKERVAVVVQTLPSTLPPSSQSLSVPVALQVWGATPLRTTLPTHTQVDRPGCIAGVTQLSTPGLGRVEEGPEARWGSLGGLPGPASFLLLRPRPAGVCL